MESDRGKVVSDMLAELPWAAIWALLALLGLLIAGGSLLEGFPWEALATLLTGFAAVIGAVYVGKRQTEIANRQNIILNQQTELERLKIRSDLYERRFHIFEVTQEYLRLSYNGQDFMDHPLGVEFKKVRDQATFLFDAEFSKYIEEIYKHVWQYHGLQLFVNSNAEKGMGNPNMDAAAIIEAQSCIGRDMSALVSMFEKYLKLSDDTFEISPHALI